MILFLQNQRRRWDFNALQLLLYQYNISKISVIFEADDPSFQIPPLNLASKEKNNKKKIFAVKDVSARAIQHLPDALWQDVSKGIQHPRMIPTPEKDKQIHLPGCTTRKHHERT